jgi:hypothetical protein
MCTICEPGLCVSDSGTCRPLASTGQQVGCCCPPPRACALVLVVRACSQAGLVLGYAVLLSLLVAYLWTKSGRCVSPAHACVLRRRAHDERSGRSTRRTSAVMIIFLNYLQILGQVGPRERPLF